MQKLLFEREMISEKEEPKQDVLLEKIANDRQSVHESAQVKKTKFFTQKLVERYGKQDWKKAAESYKNKIKQLLKRVSK